MGRFLISVRADCSQPLVVQSEVVGDFMAEHTTDCGSHLLVRPAAHLDRPLVDADLVRQDQAVVVGPFRLRDAVVESQKLCWMAHSRPACCLWIRPIFHHDLDVVHLRSKSRGQVVQRFGHEEFKGVAVHGAFIIPRLASAA